MSYERAKSGKWTLTTQISTENKLTIKADAPSIEINPEGKIIWKESAPLTFEQECIKRNSWKRSVILKVPKPTKFRFTAKYFEGKAENLPFRATLEYALDNENRFMKAVKGVYDANFFVKFIFSRSYEKEEIH